MSRGSLVVAFRTEGGVESGLGHVVRCLALASQLTPPARCVFVMETTDDHVLGKVTAAGHQVIGLRREAAPEEAAEAVRRLGPEAVVVDLPGADHAALRGTTPALVVIDDLGLAECCADIIVNGTVVPEFRAYAILRTGDAPSLRSTSPRRAATQFLLGPAYMVLRDEFARCGAQVRGFPRIARRAVVSMGGSDQRGLTPRVVRALDTVEAIEHCLVVAGPICRTADALRDAAGESRMACRVVTDPPAMAPLLVAADLAVICGGMTLYEAAAVGTPSIALPQAAPQVVEIEHFVRDGAAASVDGGLEPDLSHLAAVARDLASSAEHRKEMSRCARALVDGQGAHRVATAILRTLAAPVP